MIAGVVDEKICLFDFLHRHSLDVIKRRISNSLNAEFTAGHHPLMDQLTLAVSAYFSGACQSFSLPIQLCGTPFQIEVWEALQKIEYGTTRSYQEQARLLGNEHAIRAIAAINGMNALAIIIPCHRVLASNGAFTGYSGGLAAKSWLLAHERRHAGLAMQGELF